MSRRSSAASIFTAPWERRPTAGFTKNGGANGSSPSRRGVRGGGSGAAARRSAPGVGAGGRGAAGAVKLAWRGLGRAGEKRRRGWPGQVASLSEDGGEERGLILRGGDAV